MFHHNRVRRVYLITERCLNNPLGQVCYPKISNDKNIGSMPVALPNVWEVLEDARVWLPRYIVTNGRE